LDASDALGAFGKKGAASLSQNVTACDTHLVINRGRL
jgi:hypothetical protein